jgi:hypothetical protein
VNIFAYAKRVSEVWRKLSMDEQDCIAEYFHLRPAKSGITLVSALPAAPTKGSHPYIKTIEELLRSLHLINTNLKLFTG